jgi:small subunit ribosomal protein S4
MGDPRKLKKQYATPAHPWQKARIEAENVLVLEFGLKNKTEIYRHATQVKRFIENFKRLNFLTDAQAQVEREQLYKRLIKLGFLSADAAQSAVLDMTVRAALDRRLQTLVYKQKLAKSMKQARQMITHRHIAVNGKLVDAPGYIVDMNQEQNISFIQRSAFISELHPERVSPQGGSQ